MTIWDALDTYDGFSDRSRSDVGLAGYDEWKSDVGPWPGGDDQQPARSHSDSSTSERTFDDK
jgi:hypothetical protein